MHLVECRRRLAGKIVRDRRRDDRVPPIESIAEFYVTDLFVLAVYETGGSRSC
mgnify:CR=1 FL=1